MSELEQLVHLWKRRYEKGMGDVYGVCADALEKALADLPTFEIGD